MSRYERLEQALARTHLPDAGPDELGGPLQREFAEWVHARFGGDPAAAMAAAQARIESEFRLPRPVSAVPRILPKSMCQKLVDGVHQRVRLFRAVHQDLVSGGWIRSRYPEFETMLRTYRKFAPPGGIRLPQGLVPLNTVLGCDLILPGDGTITTNEDNTGSDVLGPSDMFNLRDAFAKAMPDALDHFGVPKDLRYPAEIERLARLEMRRLGVEGEICWIRSNIGLDRVRANQDVFFERELKAFDALTAGTALRHVVTQDIEVVDGWPRIKGMGERIGHIFFNGHPAWIAAVPGLSDAIADGKVGFNAYANAEFIGDQTLQCFLSELAEQFLPDEKLLIEPLATFAMSPRFDGELDPEIFDAWARHPERFVLKERSSAGGKGVRVGRFVSEEEHRSSLEQIRANPAEFLVQAYTPISRFGERRIDLRMICHVGLSDETTWVVPSGVSRSSASKSGKTNLSLGGQEHDTWFSSR
jgi:uncharacterized circularly permuted ATP-grasp superfamily protein